MKLDGTDVVRTRMYYKDHSYRVDGVDVKHKVFVDWGESFCEDYVIYGSPFQIGLGFAPQGVSVDVPVLFTEELVPTSFPQDAFTATLTNGPVHFKPGINV